MLLGAIIGGAMVLVIGAFCEFRLAIERNENEELFEKIDTRDKVIDELLSKLEEIDEDYKDLANKSFAMVRDYKTLAELLFEELGEDEANKRFADKKVEKDTPKDLNLLIKERVGAKDENN